MKREGEEDQSLHTRQRRNRLRLRGHAAAERFAAGDQRQAWRETRRFYPCGEIQA